MAEEAGLRPVTGRIEQSEIPDGASAQLVHQIQQVFQAEVFGTCGRIFHARPSLSSTGPHRSSISAVASRTRSV